MAQSVLYGMLETIRDIVIALDLPGISGDNVVISASPANEIISAPAVRFPGVWIGPFGAETLAAANNLRDDVVYPMLVAVCDSLKITGELAGEQNVAGLDQRLYWREAIRATLSNQRMSSSVGFNMRVEPLTIVDTAAWQRDLWVSPLKVLVTNREGRT